MAYNPGVSYRGEILGQSIGAAGQSIAQMYGQGLRLKEEQKRYGDLMKQRRRDRRNLKKSYATQAELFGMDKDDVETLGLGELQGFVEGTKAKQRFEHEGLQLQRLQDQINQDEKGRSALSQFHHYLEGGVDALTAADDAIANMPDLNIGTANMLKDYATSGAKLDLELRQVQAREQGLELQAAGQDVSRRAVGVQERQATMAEQQLEESKKPTEGRVIDVDGTKYHEVGDRIFPVDDEGEFEEPVASAEGTKVTSNVEELIGDLQHISEGDDRWFLFNLRSRQTHASKQIKTIAKHNREYKAKFGKDHPDYIRLLTRVAPFINRHKDSEDAVNKNLARRLAEELGITID